MKTKNDSSKAFHNARGFTQKTKTFAELVDATISKIDSRKAEKQSINAFKEIIQRCYNNRQAQRQLCQVLNIPFFPGPVALNYLPDFFLSQQYFSTQDIEVNIINQASYLFEYLKKTKQYYYCWIIYYNEELKVLSVKMMKKFELRDNIELLNSKYCMIGIFVDREVCKKQSNPSILINSSNQVQKPTALSCYICTSDGLQQKDENKKAQAQKITPKFINSEPLYSLKGLNSDSKTNSSSFKNEFSHKQSQNSTHINGAEDIFFKKERIFKKKKEKILLSDTKINKSISTKFEGAKNVIKAIKSLQKVQLPRNIQNHEQIKSKQKQQIIRKIKNFDSLKQNLKFQIFLGEDKIQLKRYDKSRQKNLQSLISIKDNKLNSIMIKKKSLTKSKKSFVVVIH